MTEKQLQSAIVHLARMYGYKCHEVATTRGIPPEPAWVNEAPGDAR